MKKRIGLVGLVLLLLLSSLGVAATDRSGVPWEKISDLSPRLGSVKVSVYDYNAPEDEQIGRNGVVLAPFSVPLEEGMTASEAVRQAFDLNGIESKGLEEDFLSSVNGLGNLGGYSGWCFSYNNDDYSNMGLASVSLHAGDSLRFDYSYNMDQMTDDIGNGWYGLPIITALNDLTFGKSTVYDENWNSVTEYYQICNGEQIPMQGSGTKDDPFVITLESAPHDYETMPSGHYCTVKGWKPSAEKMTLVLSTLGKQYRCYYQIECKKLTERTARPVSRSKESTVSEEDPPLPEKKEENAETVIVAQEEPPAPVADVSGIFEKLAETVSDPTVSSVGGEWAVIALSCFDAKQYAPLQERYLQNLTRILDERNGVLSARKYTEYARAALAVKAAGKDPRRVDGVDLLQPLADVETVLAQGCSAAAFALLALRDEPGGQEEYLNFLRSHQNADGSFSLGETGDVDVTAMVLTALSCYEEPEMTERALAFLSAVQKDDGGFAVGNAETSESCSQVIIALCSLGIPLSDPRFVKNGKTVEDALCSFRVGDGFCHTAGGEVSLMSTEQACCALAAIRRGGLYFRMDDLIKRVMRALNDSAHRFERPVRKQDLS